MLLGEYEHTLDDKNRLTLPAKFRQAFAGTSSSRAGIDGCLFVFTRDRLGRLRRARTRGAQPLQPRGSADEPLHVRGRDRDRGRQAGPHHGAARRSSSTPASGRDVVVAGVRDHVEIWDRDAWRKQLEEVEGSVELVAERLAAKQD